MKDFARRQWDSFTPVGQFWLALGIGALIVDAAISFKYGWTQTSIHAAGFAMLAIFFAFLPDQAALMWERRKYFASLSMWAVTVCIGVMAYWSHVGYGAGVRVGDIQQTGVQNTIHKTVNKSVDSEEKNLENWRNQLASKERERDTLKAANPWAAKTSPDALKADIANMEGDMLFARSKQCANVTLKDSRAFCDRLTALRKQLGEFNQMNKIAADIDSLNSQIAGTQRVIDGKIKEAKGTEFKSSSVVNQVSTAGQLYLAFSGAKPEDTLEPDRVVVSYANLIITAGGSLAFMLMAPIGFFIAGRNRKSDADIAEAARDIATAQAQSKPIILHEKDPAWSRLVSNLQRQGLIPA